MIESSYDSRLGESRADDIDDFVPDDAEPLFGDGDPSNPVVSPIFADDDCLYATGVHCRRCHCDVVVQDRDTGRSSCPNCGWSSEDDNSPDWRERATELQEKGDVPERQAQVVALIEEGRSHREVAEELDLNKRQEVSTYVRRYRGDRDEAGWLAEFGPEI